MSRRARAPGPISLIRKSLLILIFTSTLAMYLLITYFNLNPSLVTLLKSVYHPAGYHIRVCPNILDNMLVGKWLPRNVSEGESFDIGLFLETARSQFHIPFSLDRPDGRCGDLTFSTAYDLVLFRALCNPTGDTPCCMDGKCVPANESECQCRKCYDLRQRIHAEYSKWIPLNPRCRPHNFTAKEACSLLTGGSVIVLGDAALRQVYMALLVLLRNDRLYGALVDDAQQDVRYDCIGMYMFSQRRCRPWMDRRVSLCASKVTLTFIRAYGYNYIEKLTHVRKVLLKRSRPLIITGMGAYSGVKDLLVAKNLIDVKEKFPKMIWVSADAPGLLKTPINARHQYDYILKYNEDVSTILRQINVSVLNSFALTDGVVSFDGTHYGLGLNLMKAQILLNYIADMEVSGDW